MKKALHFGWPFTLDTNEVAKQKKLIAQYIRLLKRRGLKTSEIELFRTLLSPGAPALQIHPTLTRSSTAYVPINAVVIEMSRGFAIHELAHLYGARRSPIHLAFVLALGRDEELFPASKFASELEANLIESELDIDRALRLTSSRYKELSDQVKNGAAEKLEKDFDALTLSEFLGYVEQEALNEVVLLAHIVAAVEKIIGQEFIDHRSDYQKWWPHAAAWLQEYSRVPIKPTQIKLNTIFNLFLWQERAPRCKLNYSKALQSRVESLRQIYRDHVLELRGTEYKILRR